MASTATLGISIFNRYHGNGFTQARRDLTTLRAQIAAFNNDLRGHTNILDGIPKRWKAIGIAAAAVAPSLIPVAAQALATAGSLTTMATAAAGAGGIFGAALFGAVKSASSLKKESEKLKRQLDQQKETLAGLTPGTKAYDEQLKKVNETQRRYNESLKMGTPTQKAFNQSLGNVTSAWATFIEKTQNFTLQPATVAINAAAIAVGKLVPVVKSVSPVAMSVAKAFEAWVNTRLDGWVAWLVANGTPALMALVTVGRNLASVFGSMLKAFSADAQRLGSSLVRVSEQLRGWADGGGFQRFLDYVHRNQPNVNALLKAFGQAIWNIVKILDGFNPGAIQVLTDVFRGLAAIDPGAVKALANSFLLLRSPLLWLVLNCPPLRDLIVKLLGSLNSQTVYAIAAAFVAWRVAIFAVNAGLLGTPIGWIVLAIGGLAVVITMIATKTTWFQTAWKYTWNAVKEVFGTVWNGIKAAVTAVWNFIGSKWGWLVGLLGPVGWLLLIAKHWDTIWGGIKTAVTAVWNGLRTAWGAFTGALKAAWDAVSGPLSASWERVWGVIKGFANGVWISMKQIWGGFVAAIKAIWDAVSGPLQAAWSFAWGAIKKAAELVWAALKLAWSALTTALRAAWDVFYRAFGPNWKAAWNAIKAAGEAVWNVIQAAWKALWAAVRAIWNTFYAGFKAAWSAAWNALKTVASGIWNVIKSLWQSFWNSVRAIWNTFYAGFKTAWSGAWNAIKAVGKGIWDAIRELWKSFTTNGILGVWNTFNTKLKAAWSKTWATLKDIAKSAWRGIGDVIEGAINAVTGIINKLTGGFNRITSFLKINVKIDEIPRVDFKFAEGGVVPGFSTGGAVNLRNGGALSGYAPGRDTVPAVLSKGEGVLVPEAVRGLGGAGFVHAANHHFSNGRAPRRGAPSFDAFGRQEFAVGGITAAALKRAGVPIGMISQGEYSTGVSASAGTHDRGGAVDVRSTDRTVLARLRSAGFAAWIRGVEQGMSPHIHAVLMNHPDLSGPARAQVSDFLKGGDGLGSGSGGGGGIGDVLGGLLGNVGGILKNVAQGLDPLKDIDGGGGGGIGGFLKDMAGGLMDLFLPGKSGVSEVLGEMVLGSIDSGALNTAFGWITDMLGKAVPGGDFGKIAIGIGKKTLSVIKDFILGKAKESTFNPADFAGGFTGVEQWTPLAKVALARAGISQSQLPAFMALMKAESGGNPKAINLWDSNAKIGQASQGLMQVIPSTFQAYRDQSLPNNILDPLANMTAAAKYIKGRYRGIVPGSPYGRGTPGATSGWHLVGEKGPEMVKFRGGERVETARETREILSGSGGGGGQVHYHQHGNVYVKSDREFREMVHAEFVELKRRGRI